MTDLYIEEAECQLSDTSSYLPRATNEHQSVITTTVTDLISSGDLPPDNPTARFYLLPKIHKQDCLGRPDDLRALCFFLEQGPAPFPPTIPLLAWLILTLNNFSFNSSHFLQVRGVAIDEANFNEAASEMSAFFLNRGFPSTIVDRVLNR
eukprot:g26322.t1